jgi:WD40 repeat protein
MAKLISSFRQFAFGRGFAMADKQTNTSKPTVTSVQFLPEPGFKLLLSMDNGQICSATQGEQADPLHFLHCDHGVKRQGSWWQLSASADGSTIGLAGFDGTLDLFRRGSRDRLRKLLKQPIKASAGPLQTVSIEKKGRYLAIVALNGTASLWDNKGRQLASFSTDDVASGGFLKAAFIADGSKLLLVTKEGVLQEKAVEDLPRLLDRGCETLRIFLNNPTTDTATKKRLSFCKV